jgi:hypothetical protein
MGERGDGAMDIKALEIELAQARQARLDALAAMTDVENMIHNVQDPAFGRSRLAFFISGFDEDVEAEKVEAQH